MITKNDIIYVVVFENVLKNYRELLILFVQSTISVSSLQLIKGHNETFVVSILLLQKYTKKKHMTLNLCIVSSVQLRINFKLIFHSYPYIVYIISIERDSKYFNRVISTHNLKKKNVINTHKRY